MGETFRELALSGPLLLAVGGAALAGLVSFLSPCVLPLMPGYLSYVTGLAGADLEGRSAKADPVPVDGGGGVAVAAPPVRRTAAVKGRVLAGTLLFIAGFTFVFTSTAILAASFGRVFFDHQRTLEIVLGSLVIVLGLGYLGLVPGMQREFRINRLPSAGLLGAPALGAVFALSWMPCTGPTLSGMIALATAGGRTDRAVLLAVAYCLGLGIPFIVFGLGFHRLLGVFRAVRRNSRWVTRVGGALLILIGLALVTGGWQNVVIWLQTNVGPGEVSI
ncbi:cytochrome c biogenesis CcdA family protein [Micromonospora siamensis]|uniref:Cytochrome c-type biogenesis protein n=1 Tax=Micromonospora siamensis TaxID=299152 RepID=A0A1C5H1T9_9ACTN|nr:cytochrome c biogenesis protein CcdA [Micromonospora siamensis]SCG40015.1 cytochrome c-type biogenesis protein [Micromonospora siamensis]